MMRRIALITVAMLATGLARAANVATTAVDTTLVDGLAVSGSVELAYSPVDAGSVSLAVNGREVLSATEPGTYAWTPEWPGTYLLTHRAGDATFTRKVAHRGSDGAKELEIGWLDVPVSTLLPDSYDSVTNVVILPTVTQLPEGAFVGCAALSSVTIPASVTNVGANAFSNCGALTNVVLGGDAPTVGDSAFGGVAGGCTATVNWGTTGWDDDGDGRWQGLALRYVGIPIVFEASDYEWSYDGTGHGIAVIVTEPAEGASVTYSRTADGAYAAAPILFTNMTDGAQSVYFKITADCHVATGGVATVKITAASDGGPYTETADGITWTFTVTNGEASVWSGSEYASAIPSSTTGSIAIPSALGGRPVTSIGNHAFYDCGGLTSVTIPENVTRIGYDAFRGCGSVTNIDFPSWFDCRRWSAMRKIGLSPRQLAARHDAGFAWFETIALEYVGDREMTSVGVPDGATAIADDALAGLGCLCEIELSDSLLEIGAFAFANDFCLDNVVVPDAVEEIGDGAFSNCTELASLAFGGGLKRVGDSAFENCISLESAVFQEGLTNLGARAFAGTSRLKSVSLPVSLEYVGEDAFKGSALITGVTVPTHLKTMRELFPDSYQKIETVVIPEGEGVVIDSMFAGCQSLKSVVIPASVTNVGASAFANCEALEELGLPDEVTALGARAFYGCLNLQTVSLPRKLTAIGDETFGVCPLLDSLVVPASVTRMGSKVYSGGRAYSLECKPGWSSYSYSYTTRNGVYGKWYYKDSQALTGVYFLGDAPEVKSDTYQDMPSALKSYVIKGSKGWYLAGSPTLPPDGWPTIGNARPITYWTPNEFEVTFDGCGGSPATYVAKQITDTTYSLPKSDPVRPGYLFQGWWTEKKAGAQVYWNSRVTATKAHTLYAHWKSLSDTVTVVFNPNGGTVEPAEATYPAGVTYGDLPVPTRIGHRFVGWYTAQAGGDRVDEATEVSGEDDELYAHWTPITYTVAFNANGGSGTMYAQTHTYNEARALTANGYYLNGFKFTGWAETAGGSVKYANGATVENLAEVQGQVVTLYAVWDGAKYAVRFDGNGGAGSMENQTHQVGVRQALAACGFTRKGYAFAGWATTVGGAVAYEDGEEVQNLTMQSGGAVALFAVWVPIQYGIAYHANGGAGSMASATALYDKEAEIAACGYVRSGFAFAGWSDAADGEVLYAPGGKVLNLAETSGAVVDLYAVWNRQTVAAPVFSPADGTVFADACTVTLTCPTAGADIYCRVGAKPKASGKFLYSGQFEITETSVVYAFAKLGDLESEVVTATLTKGEVMTFEKAVGAVGIAAFAHGGAAAWFAEEGAGAHTGEACARSGAVGDDEASWFEATVEGAGTVSFWWKASCEEDELQEFDHLEFIADGDEVGRLDGVTGWRNVSVTLGAGTHTLRWAYVKDESEEDGEDCGWVDDIVWTPSVTPADPIPDIGENPTRKEVAEALKGSEDPMLTANITDGATYAAYRAWAETVTNANGQAAGALAVKASPNAWVSFALGQGALLEAAPTEEDLTVEAFDPAAEDGKFDFTVSVKGVKVGDAATKENLKKVFGLEGATSLTPGAFSSDTVDIAFGTPEDGKVRFTAGPKDASAGTFFMKMKLNP